MATEGLYTDWQYRSFADSLRLARGLYERFETPKPPECKCSAGHANSLTEENIKHGYYIGHCRFVGCNNLIHWERK